MWAMDPFSHLAAFIHNKNCEFAIRNKNWQYLYLKKQTMEGFWTSQI